MHAHQCISTSKEEASITLNLEITPSYAGNSQGLFIAFGGVVFARIYINYVNSIYLFIVINEIVMQHILHIPK